METRIDSAGRIVVPKALRDTLGSTAGTTLDISTYGPGLTLMALGPTARLAEKDGRLVARTHRTVTDDEVFAQIDVGRR